MKGLISILLVSLLTGIANAQLDLEDPCSRKAQLKDLSDQCYWKDNNQNCQPRVKLDEILKAHKEYLGKLEEETHADLSNTDLSRTRLGGNDLSYA